MKYLIIILILFFSINISKSQNYIKFNKFYTTDFEFNPALTGLEYNIEGLLAVKKNWIGIKNSPATENFYVHSNIAKLGLFNAKDFLQNPLSNIGLGLTIYNDKNGPLKSSQIKLSYAYHINLLKNTKLSFGLSTHITQYSTDYDMLIYREPEHDSYFLIENSRVTPNLDFGMFLNNNKNYFGISIINLFRQGYYLNFDGTLYLSAGHNIDLNQNLKLKTNLVLHKQNNNFNIKLNKYNSMNLSANFKFYYQDKLGIGLGYNTLNSIIFYTSYMFNKILIGYNFDLTYNSIYINSQGNHMIFINFKI